MNNLKMITPTLYLDPKEIIGIEIIPNKEIIIHLRNGKELIVQGTMKEITQIKRTILGTYND